MVPDEHAEHRGRMTTQEPVLRPPGTVPDSSSTGSKARYGLWLALILMLAAALAVVFYLPDLDISGNNAKKAVVDAPADGPGPQSVPATNQQARSEAQERLRDFLQLRARLELENAALWGEPEWSQAADSADRGDRFFGQHDYAEARHAYRNGFDLLQAMDASRPARLAAALDAGQQALASDDAGTAIHQFGFALAIEPESSVATSGLARARVREDVLAFMRTGREAEGREDRDAARNAYAAALQLDGDYVQAAESLQRVTSRINDEQFRVAMGEALGALEAGRLTASGKALDIAAQLQPDAAAVRDLRQRLATAHKRGALTTLRRQSRARVATEDWQAAAGLYRKALAIDRSAAFADEGLKHARDRIRLHKQIDHYLSDPARLYADEPLANAEALLVSAGTVPAGEPRLATKIARLQRLVIGARTPVLINLRSDGQTDVVIYHVGRRGRFQQQQLELRPGTYTVTGSRTGYRDVRKVFEVRPGAAPQTVVIQCEEPV